jgi:hypothetical protein
VILGIDHIAIAVTDPDAAAEELAGFLDMPAGSSGGRHPAWGTRNRLLWLGDTYIELCTVDDPELAPSSWLGKPALAVQPGPAAIIWARSSEDHENDRQLMNDHGASLGPPIPGERRRPDGRLVRWRLSLPADVALDQPVLIEHDSTAAEWSEADRSERAASPGRLTAMDLPVEAIEGFVAAGGLQFGRQTIRLVGHSASQPTIRIEGLRRAPETSLLGCRWRLT